MKQNELYQFLNSYLNFRNNLLKHINDCKRIHCFNNCYLIEESWVNVLEKYKNIVPNQKEDLLANISFPEKDPLFINDFINRM